jgi:hypothetical protein
VTTTFISKRLNDVAVRTARCNDIIRREPREIPRRLRGLLLAIDGRQPVRTYLSKLDGFGDVEALLSELATLGLIELKSPRRRRTVAPDGGAANGDSRLESNFGDSVYADSNFAPMSNFGSDSIYGDSTVLPDAAHRAQRAERDEPPPPTRQGAAMLGEVVERRLEPFAATLPGTFDDLVRVARLTNPGYDPAAPKVVAPTNEITRELDAQRQVDSLFVMLEAVRGERRELKERVTQLRKNHRELTESLQRRNSQLLTAVCVLAGICLVLGGTHLLRF